VWKIDIHRGVHVMGMSKCDSMDTGDMSMVSVDADVPRPRLRARRRQPYDSTTVARSLDRVPVGSSCRTDLGSGRGFVIVLAKGKRGPANGFGLNLLH
jgi:hypothetical protein